MLERLVTSSEPDAMELLQQLRASSDLPTIVASINGGMQDKIRPSQLLAARSASPPTASILAFELSVLHPNVYQKLPPIDITTISFDPLAESMPLLHATKERDRAEDIHRTRDSTTSYGPHDQHHAHIYPRLPSWDSSVANNATQGPYIVQALCDSRLYRLRIDYWTRIPVSNDFAACIISSYLVKDHPLLGLFDADLFTGDLIGHRLDFCSAFLVSSLMYYASVRCHP